MYWRYDPIQTTCYPFCSSNMLCYSIILINKKCCMHFRILLLISMPTVFYLTRSWYLCLNPFERRHNPACLLCTSRWLRCVLVDHCSETANQKLQAHFITAHCVCAWRRHAPSITETIWHRFHCMSSNLVNERSHCPRPSVCREMSARGMPSWQLAVDTWTSLLTDTDLFEGTLWVGRWEKCLQEGRIERSKSWGDRSGDKAGWHKSGGMAGWGRSRVLTAFCWRYIDVRQVARWTLKHWPAVSAHMQTHITYTSMRGKHAVYVCAGLCSFVVRWDPCCNLARLRKGGTKGRFSFSLNSEGRPKCHRGCPNACFVRHGNSIIVMEDKFQLSSPSWSIQVSCPHTPASFRHKNTTVKWPPVASKRLDENTYCCIDLIAIFFSHS